MSNKRKVNNFKIFRITKGLTQEELAEKVGISTRTIGLYESGKRLPTVDVAKKIAIIFEKGIEEIFFTN